MFLEVRAHKSSVVPGSTCRRNRCWKTLLVAVSRQGRWHLFGVTLGRSPCADGQRRLLKVVLSTCSLTFCSGLNVSAEFMKFRRFLKRGTVKIRLVTLPHTALIWSWNRKCWLASGPWSCEGERSHLKWLLAKTLQFCYFCFRKYFTTIQVLNSVRLLFLCTVSLKRFTRGWY